MENLLVFLIAVIFPAAPTRVVNKPTSSPALHESILCPLNKVGSMTHITQVDIRVYVYNFINFSLTIVKSFFGHKDMTFYKPSL